MENWQRDLVALWAAESASRGEDALDAAEQLPWWRMWRRWQLLREARDHFYDRDFHAEMLT